MKKSKKKRSAPFSGLSVMKKFVFFDIIMIAAIISVGTIMVTTVMNVTAKKYLQIEKTVISSTEQMTTIGVESAVSIAKNIYTNEPVYDFLNKEFKSSSAYFEEYYPLQKNTALSTADTNIVKKCVIYTSNPTILANGTMKSLDEAYDDLWYKDITKYNKPTILSVDPSEHLLILVRKLDYCNLETGESYLCLILNNDYIKDYVNNLDFEGQFYIMSGGELIYSNDDEMESVSDVAITPDFECVTHNYYTVDMEFYASADKESYIDFLTDNKFLIPCLSAILIITLTAGIVMAKGINKRIRPVLKEFNDTGIVESLSEGANGSDEIGSLLDICASMSERLAQKGSEYKESSDSLMKKSSDYNSLFTTAMRLDAELTAINTMPYLEKRFTDENISLSDEAAMLEKTAEQHNASFTYDGGGDNIIIPAYSLVLIAEDIFSNFDGRTAKLTVEDGIAIIKFESEKTVTSSETLKLYAIFEDADVTSEYSFDRSNRFNPYLRIRHCLGNSVEMVINEKNNFKIMFKIRMEKGE